MSELHTSVRRCDRCCRERDVTHLADATNSLRAEGWVQVAIIHLGGMDLCPTCARRLLAVLVEEAPHAEGKPAGTIVFAGTPKHIGFFTPKQVFREANEAPTTQNEKGGGA